MGLLVFYRIANGTSDLYRSTVSDRDLRDALKRLAHMHSDGVQSTVFCDNNGAIWVAVEPSYTGGPVLGQYWMRRFVKSLLELEPPPAMGPIVGYVPGKDNPADVFSRMPYRCSTWCTAYLDDCYPSEALSPPLFPVCPSGPCGRWRP